MKGIAENTGISHHEFKWRRGGNPTVKNSKVRKSVAAPGARSTNL